MSSIAIISDIHGNINALDAVLKDIAKREIKTTYCLGDLVGYYCYFNEVVDRIRESGIPSILGNHDYAFVNTGGVIDRSKTCTKILHWQIEHAKTTTGIFLQSLPDKLVVDHADKSILFVHGGLQDPVDEYLFDVNEEYFSENNFIHDVLVTGHTHLICYKKFYSGKTWINPGSVGQPRDGNNRASYIIINENFDVNFIRVKYDFLSVIKKMEELGFEKYISEPLITGRKIGL